MSFLPNPIACDVCGIVKGQANHWFYADASKGEWIVWTWASEAEDRGKNYTHLCGHVCAVKKLSEWMSACATPATRDTVS